MKVLCDPNSSAVVLPLLGTSVNEPMAGVTGGSLCGFEKLLTFSRKLEVTEELPWVLFITRGGISFVGLGDFLEVGLLFLTMFIYRGFKPSEPEVRSVCT